MEALRARRQNDDPEDQQRQHLRPQHIDARALQEHAAHDLTGMLRTGNVNPLSRKKGMKHRNVDIIACCWVCAIVEMNSPAPRDDIRNSIAFYANTRDVGSDFENIFSAMFS